MLSLAEATAPSTAKKRQCPSRLDAGVDPKRRRCEANGKVQQPNVKAPTSNNKAQKSSGKNAAPAVASSSLKVTETLSAREQPSEEGPCRGRRRWRAGSEPQGWDEREWYAGDSMVASFEDRPEKPKKNASKSTTNASTSAHNSDEPFDYEFLDVSSSESERIQPSSKVLAASVQNLKMIQHNGK
ncbi:hypothetical protein ACHAO4_003086 [Trichoderma viride]